MAVVSVKATIRSLLLAALSLAPVASSAQSPTEYELEAIFLYNFTKYVTWPDEQSSETKELHLCLLGSDPFGEVLDDVVRGETVRGRTLTVRRIETVADATECELLYVSASEEPRLERVLLAVAGTSVLTVGNFEGFAEKGGMIRLRKDARRIRIEINAAASERAGLRLSSQLLKLGKIVVGGSS